MEKQQRTRLSRRALFQSLPHTEQEQPVSAAHRSLLASPIHANDLAATRDDRILRGHYIEAYWRLSEESHDKNERKHSPRYVHFHDRFGGLPKWAGPNIEQDIDLFRGKYLADPEPFHKDTSLLVCMYGLGLKELEFLARNPNQTEREEQLETLELYHLLKFFLGASNVADLSEQLEFCFYTLKRSRSAWMEAPRVRGNQHARRGRDAAMGRRREFQIAKVMADRLWEQLLVDGQRVTPVILRRQILPNGHRREGDWHRLSLGERYRLLGGEDLFYQQHGLYPQLAETWLPSPEVPPRAFVPESRKPIESTILYGPLREEPGHLFELSHGVMYEFRLAALARERQEKWLRHVKTGRFPFG